MNRSFRHAVPFATVLLILCVSMTAVAGAGTSKSAPCRIASLNSNAAKRLSVSYPKGGVTHVGSWAKGVRCGSRLLSNLKATTNLRYTPSRSSRNTSSLSGLRSSGKVSGKIALTWQTSASPCDTNCVYQATINGGYSITKAGSSIDTSGSDTALRITATLMKPGTQSTIGKLTGTLSPGTLYAYTLSEVLISGY